MNTTQKRNLFPFSPFHSGLLEKKFLGSEFANDLPVIIIKENLKEYKVEVSAPGLEKEDFKITSEYGFINIKTVHKENKEIKDERDTTEKYNSNSFCRSFAIPENVKDIEIKASYEDGILKLNLPKKPKKYNSFKKKKIKVI